MRTLASNNSKEFKTGWIKLSTVLCSIYEDKTYLKWGYEKFPQYTETELKISKSLATKLVKTHKFCLSEEPLILNEHSLSELESDKTPSFESMDLLRRARSKKELTQEDYNKIRERVMTDNAPLAVVRKELTAIIKSHKEVDSVEEKEKRTKKAIKKVLHELDTFKRDMENEKLLPPILSEKIGFLMTEIKQTNY